MQCPFCDFDGARRAVHQHLAETHGEQVRLRVDEEKGQRFYSVVCPICHAPYEHLVKPRHRDADFLREFDREIKLVAFDMLLYHAQGEHMQIPNPNNPNPKEKEPNPKSQNPKGAEQIGGDEK